MAADDLRDLFGPVPTPFQRELHPILERIQANLLAGKRERGLFTNEYNAIEALLERYPLRPEIVAEWRYAIALAHWKVFDEPQEAIQRLEELKRNYPDTSYAKKAELDIEAIPKIDAGIALRKTLVVGKALPDFTVQDMDGRALSLSSYRGKPVLLLTWNVDTAPLLQLTLGLLRKKYEPATFAVLGLNTDEKEAVVRGYLKTNAIPGRHYFDGRGARNELVLKYGLRPAGDEFVLDRQGRIVSFGPTTLDELEAALATAVKHE
jgi:hypothetical protein